MEAAGLYETSADFNQTKRTTISRQNVKRVTLFFFPDEVKDNVGQNTTSLLG